MSWTKRGFGAWVVAVTAGILMAGVFTASPTTAAATGAPLASSPAPTLIDHANLYVNETPPTGTTPAGETIGAVFAVQAPAYPASASAGTVRIPASVMELPSSTGELRVYFAALNLTIHGANATSGAPGPSVRFTTGIQFNTSPPAFLSTQGLSVMASWAYGAYPVEFRWQWVLVSPDGSTGSGPWSNWTSVTPPQLVDLSAPSSQAWTVGAPQSLCVNGTIAGRTFSAHVSTSNPAAVFVTATVTVPAGQTAPYCWQNTLPVGTPSQTAYVHLWEYENLTFQLVIVGVQLISPTGGGGGGGAVGGGPGINWFAVAAIATVVLATLVALEVAYVLSPPTFQRILRRPTGTGLTPGAPPPPPPPSEESTAASAASPSSGVPDGAEHP
ncbi:MAG: hypothetical protein L3K17_06540 [Thermoplasmata archaeon]|nr:hypothetical protein [Thermoplasmata archaeon]